MTDPGRCVWDLVWKRTISAEYYAMREEVTLHLRNTTWEDLFDPIWESVGRAVWNAVEIKLLMHISKTLEHSG